MVNDINFCNNTFNINNYEISNQKRGEEGLKIKKIILPLILLTIVFFSGCSDYVQLHQKLIIQAIGVDHEEGKYSITVQALDFKNLEEKDKPTIKVLELEGLTVMEALGNISTQTGLKPLYSQNLMLIIGKPTAEEGINKLVDFFIHHYEMRPNVTVCLSTDKASDILKLESNGKVLEAKNIFDMINKDMKSDMIHFVGNIQNGVSDPYIPLLRIEKGAKNSKIVSDTIAVFKNDTLSYTLDKDLSQGLLLVNGVSNPGVCVVKDLENFGDTAFELGEIKTKIDVKIKDNYPEYFINIKAKANTFEIDKNLFNGNPEEIKKVLEKKLAEKLKEISQQTILECVRNKSDVFGFGQKLLNKNPNYFRPISNSWKDMIKNYEFHVNVQAEISDIGIFS